MLFCDWKQIDKLNLIDDSKQIDKLNLIGEEDVSRVNSKQAVKSREDREETGHKTRSPKKYCCRVCPLPALTETQYYFLFLYQHH